MSFVISANKLFMLTQSRRLRCIWEGKFSVEVLHSPTTTPFYCDLSSKTIQIALDAALAGTKYLSTNWEESHKTFMAKLLQKQEAFEVVHERPTVHAELVLIKAMTEGKIKGVEPYIGVSKLSCIMCSNYICAFNEVTEQKVATKGSHGKAYPGWSWPSLPSLDKKLRPAFLNLMREQLLLDFRHYVERIWRRSGMESDLPRLTEDEFVDLI